MYTKILWFLLVISQLAHPILGCDYKILDLAVNSYTRNIWSSNREPISIKTIKDNLFFLSDEEKIDAKYTKQDNFNKLCEEIKLEIKNQRFLSFFKNCESIYNDPISDYTEKYATHILLEAVKNRFCGELDYFKRLDAFHEKQKVFKSFQDMTISSADHIHYPNSPGASPTGTSANSGK